MRTFRVFLILLVSSVGHAMAQVGQYRSDLAIGVNGGYTLNKVTFNPTIKQSFHNGLTGGVTLRYTSERYYSILCALQAELNYAQLGWKELIETSGDTYERSITYVQLPLLARLAFGKEHRGVCGFIALGPQVGYVLGSKEKRGGEWSEATLSLRPNNITAQYDLPVQNKFEYGLAGGAGMEISTSVGHFVLEGRYFYALSDIFKNGKADAFSRSANGTITVKLSYLFDIKRTKR